MLAHPKIREIVNLIVAQTDCGVFVINAILYLSFDVSKLGKIRDKKFLFYITIVRFSSQFFYLISPYESKIL